MHLCILIGIEIIKLRLVYSISGENHLAFRGLGTPNKVKIIKSLPLFIDIYRCGYNSPNGSSIRSAAQGVT